MERPRGIEPLSLPWQGRVLPLNHGRMLVLNQILMVPRVRIELTTRRSSGVCSTTELPRRIYLLNGFGKPVVGDKGFEPLTPSV